ncbi:MAG: hypothetical protein ABSG54_15570 [Terriglobia bacterium]|jgi:hypothetical protein
MEPSINLTPPTLDYVQGRIREFDRSERFNEPAVGLVFQQWPANTDYAQVLVKTIVLNRLYSTNVYNVQKVAKQIVDLKIDEPLRRGDCSLVEKIAGVNPNRKPFLLSFATKYCSWHQPELYQIYDSTVDMLLSGYQKQFNFASFRREELRDYENFLAIVDKFRSHFGLTSIGRKQLDKFLWMEGKQPSTNALGAMD